MTRPESRAPVSAGVSAPSISEREFGLLQALIYELSGIHLSPGKSSLMAGRLTKRLHALGLDSFHAYYRYLMDDGDPAERGHMLDCIVTNETSFFREPAQFEFLEQTIVPAWRKSDLIQAQGRRVRVWCAGCSTGQEAYSVAMVLLTHLASAAGWSVEVLGTDLSSRALNTAQAGVWPVSQAAEIPERYLRRFMRRGVRSEEGNMTASAELREVVQFRRQNLKDTACTGLFDLILCRNVLIYFDARSRLAVVEQLASCLSPGGYFFVGHAESLKGLTDRLEIAAPTIARAVSPAARPNALSVTEAG